MNSYYFTFGQGHRNLDGEEMKDYWVRVITPYRHAARAKFCQDFAKPIMGDSLKWAFQYEECEFDKELYPKGEYACLEV